MEFGPAGLRRRSLNCHHRSQLVVATDHGRSWRHSPKQRAQVRGQSGLDLHSGRPNADPPITGQDRRDVELADHPSAPSEPAAPHQQETRRSRPRTRAEGLNSPEVAGRRFNDEPLRSQKPRWEIRSCFHQIVRIRRKAQHSDRHARSLLKMKAWVNSLPQLGRPVIWVASVRLRPNSVVNRGFSCGRSWGRRRPEPSYLRYEACPRTMG